MLKHLGEYMGIEAYVDVLCSTSQRTRNRSTLDVVCLTVKTKKILPKTFHPLDVFYFADDNSWYDSHVNPLLKILPLAQTTINKRNQS